MIFGSLSGLFIFGDLIESALRTAMKIRVYGNEIPIAGTITDIGKIIKELDIGDIDPEDVKDALGALWEASENFGIPSKYLSNIPKGIDRLLEKDWRNGLGLLMGWSEYSLGIDSSKDEDQGSGRQKASSARKKASTVREKSSSRRTK
jgi:hypothetical protein